MISYISLSRLIIILIDKKVMDFFNRLTCVVLSACCTSFALAYEEQIEERGHKHKGGGGGGYKPHHDVAPYKPKKCHPQTITKYKTVVKDRKANVFNQVIHPCLKNIQSRQN